MVEITSYAAFSGDRLIAFGPLPEVLRGTKAFLTENEDASILIFDDASGQQIDFDLRGTLAQVLERALPSPERAGPGRPKLGVVAREVTLLPRHWAWLERQPSGSSAALRRLVDEARKRDPDEQRTRRTREAVSKLMTALAGNREHYEEASRALFAKDDALYAHLIRSWPRDVRDHLLRLLRSAPQPVAATALPSLGEPNDLV